MSDDRAAKESSDAEDEDSLNAKNESNVAVAKAESPGSRSSSSSSVATAEDNDEEDPKPSARWQQPSRRDRWNQQLERLCVFQRKHGHCRVPRSFVVDSVQLGKWVNRQRMRYKHRCCRKEEEDEDDHAGGNNNNNNNTILDAETAQRIAQLNAIGFEWNATGTTLTEDESWQQMFQRVCQFKRQNGHCRVPKHYVVDSIKLGGWVKRQREYYKCHMAGKTGHGASITEERIAQLNGIGFEWKLRDQGPDSKLWNSNYQLLCAFQREHGHCRVPQRSSSTGLPIKLGKWVKDQRHLYKNHMLGKTGHRAAITPERIERLNAIGFEWKLRDYGPECRRWQNNYELLCEFQREHGHCRVPQRLTYKSVTLGRWVKDQRNFFKKHMEGQRGHGASITEERIAQLNEIGFEWKVK